MRKFLIAAAIASCCAAALPAAAAPVNEVAADQATDQSAAATEQPRAANPDRLICASARLSESRIPRRICRTRAEWDAMRAEEAASGR